MRSSIRQKNHWLKNHRLLAFFVLAYAIAWSSWPLYAAGLMPRVEFLPAQSVKTLTL